MLYGVFQNVQGYPPLVCGVGPPVEGEADDDPVACDATSLSKSLPRIGEMLEHFSEQHGVDGLIRMR